MNRSPKNWLLETTQIYAKFQKLMYVQNSSEVLVSEYIKPFTNCTVLDVGCGPAAILNYLPKTKYFGLDHNAKYITAASKKYGAKGTFICAEVDQLGDYGLKSFDRILLLGVMHHLTDDQLSALMASIKGLLNSDGILITFDVALEDNQHPVAKFLAKNDRGKFVRTKSHYLSFIEAHFSLETADIRREFLRMPYTQLLTRSTFGN